MSNTGNTQQIIDYGAAPNDGTGDPLRTAFIKTDENFDNVWLAGPVGSNITIANNVIQSNNTNGNITIKPNGIGVLQVNGSILPDITQIRDLGSANRRFRSLYLSGDIDSTGDVTIDGNLTVNGTTVTINVANLDITDKMIVIANGSPSSFAANNSGITVAGANAQLIYRSGTNSWNSNKNFIAEQNFSIGSGANVGWDFVNQPGGGFITFPSGARWASEVNNGSSDEYISSGNNGFLTFSAEDINLQLQTEIKLEHGFVRIKTYNGIDYEWDFNNDGSFTVPGNIQALGEVISSGEFISNPRPLANLAISPGARAFASDANLVAAGNFGAQVAGGGSNTVPIWSDGTNWYIG